MDRYYDIITQYDYFTSSIFLVFERILYTHFKE